VIGWLRARDRSRRFFLWVHFYDPHIPNEPAGEFREQAGGDAYRGEIAAADRALGRIAAELRALALDDSTLLVLTADHGESLGEHGEPTHGALCYEATLRVPLVFRFPAGRTPEPGPARFASVVDLAPTILARLGCAVPADLDGLDLFAPDAPADRGVYCESLSGYLNYGWSTLCGWVDARGKYLHSSRPELYHPLEDPEERVDLAPNRQEECAQALARIGAVLARPALAAAAAPPDEELRAALGALGYAQSGGALDELPPLLEPGERPSPRERAHELEPLLVAHALFQEGRYAECLPRVQRLVDENPGHLLALDLLGLCLMHAGRFEEAQAILRQRLARGPERADTRLNLGLALLETGAPEAALAELEAAERLQPGERSIAEALARARDALGRSDAAADAR
jgi:tetratricopeptide (TPR) repeat protein